MYPKKLARSLFSPQPNLKILIKDTLPNKYLHLIRTSLNKSNSVNQVRNIVELLLKNAALYRLFHNTLRTTPRAFKDSSANLLRVWAHQCECVLAQRLRRTQQMFCMYTRIWEERALKDFIRNLRLALVKQGKNLVLSAVGISAYNWDENRIPVEDLTNHENDIDYIYVLKKHTICLECDPTARSKNQKDGKCACGKPRQIDPNRMYDDWSPFLEKEDLVVWRRLNTSSGAYEYKVFGSYNDVTAEDFLNVQVDTIYRQKWDTTAVALEVAETDPTPDANSDIIYWEMLWPRLFVNRDYVFKRRYFVDEQRKTLFICSKSTEHPNFPKYKDKFRIEDYWSYMVIKPYDDMAKKGIEFSLTYYDNPGVNLPSSVTTWVASKAMPDFLEKLREAAKNYKQYCIEEGVSEVCKQLRREHEDEYLDMCSITNEPIIILPKTSKHASKESKKTIQDTEHRKPIQDNSGSKERRKKAQDKSGTNLEPSGTPEESPLASKQDDNSYWKYFYPTYYF